MLAGAGLIVAAAPAAPAGGLAPSSAELCAPPEPGVDCGPGNNRQPPGGGAKVPHDNGLNSRKGQRATRVWPKVSGILWQVVDSVARPPHPHQRRVQTRSCEHIRHFCAHGETKDGRCLSPTGKPVASARHSG